MAVMTKEQMLRHLRRSNEIALKVKEAGRHPFGALLVAADGETILMEQGNINTIRHAEIELARSAAEKYTPEFLWDCTLVTNFEPCAMCAGGIYWANIGAVVYGVSESKLLEITGDHEENMTLNLPCRIVIGSGQKDIRIDGPFEEVEEEIIKLHEDMWD